MTSFNFDTSNAPAARPARQLLAAACAFSLVGVASVASAQSSVPIAASAQQSTTQAPAMNEVTSPDVEDRFKPRIYGGPQVKVTRPAPVAAPAPATNSQVTTTTTIPSSPARIEQQVNVIKSEPKASPPINTGASAVSPNVNPNLPPNAQLNSAPKWTDGIRTQFIDVIAGVPIIKDPTTCSAGNPGVKIKVVNVKDTEGVIVADLHNDVKENFLVWDEVILRVRATALEDETTFCVPVPKAGDYAIAIYHDKNGNKEFDKNFLGIPKERFGMSNNPKFTTKSPEYEESVFTVPATGMEMLIKLRKSSDVLSGNQD